MLLFLIGILSAINQTICLLQQLKLECNSVNTVNAAKVKFVENPKGAHYCNCCSSGYLVFLLTLVLISEEFWLRLESCQMCRGECFKHWIWKELLCNYCLRLVMDKVFVISSVLCFTNFKTLNSNYFWLNPPF